MLMKKSYQSGVSAIIGITSILMLACSPVYIRNISVSSFDGLSKVAKVKGYVALHDTQACNYTKVYLLQKETDTVSYVSETNEEGYFEFNNICPGEYKIRIDGCDFANQGQNIIKTYKGEMLVISIMGHTLHDYVVD
jgi:hypothetical protein